MRLEVEPGGLEVELAGGGARKGGDWSWRGGSSFSLF